MNHAFTWRHRQQGLRLAPRPETQEIRTRGRADQCAGARSRAADRSRVALSAPVGALTVVELRGRTAAFRARVEAGAELDDLIPEAFVTVREAAKRTLGQRHFDVQLIGGMVLHEGRIAEMKTGEGKTLVATMPVYLNALAGRGVHVVTVNDYLAKRDA